MLQVFLKTITIMAVFSAFAVPGFILKKCKMIGDGGMLSLSNVLLYVCQPALAIKAFCVFDADDWQIIQSIETPLLLKNFGIAAAISVLAIGLVFGLCKLVFIKSKDRRAADVYSFIAVFSNCGFFGIPFVEMFTDGNPLAVMYIMVFNVFFNLLVWTLGVYLLTGNLKEIRVKKLVLNPAVFANFVALLLFFVPQINIFMMDGVKEFRIFPQYLAYMTAPLSMIIVGVRLAETPVKELFCIKGVYVAGALRLIAAPLVTLAICLPFRLLISGETPFEEYVCLAPIIAMAMSPAASVVAMAERFDGDKKTATSAFVTNTLLSIVTIPLLMTFVTAVF